MNIFKRKKKNINDWMKLAYPIPANEAAQGTWVEATKHSLNKYKYSTPAKFKKFNLNITGVEVEDNNTKEYCAMFGGDKCSLCRKSVLDTDKYNQCYNCDNCPLGKLGYKCNMSGSPYIDFRVTRDPTRMIMALEEVIRKLESGELVME